MKAGIPVSRSLPFKLHPIWSKSQLRRCSRGRKVEHRAEAAYGSPSASSSDNKGGFRAWLWKASSIFHPFHDSKANARFVSLAMGGMLCSIATLIHDSFLPTFMKEELGMTNTRIGSVQAISQLLAQISKSCAGIIGDILRSQVKILVLGVALTAAVKPMFALSSFVLTNFGVSACLWCITIGKMVDRFSRGLRDSPTKALISRTAVSVQEPADAAFSVRQSIASIGALTGSAIASAVFFLSGQSYIATFAAASVPPVLALLWVTVVFREDLKPGSGSKPSAINEPPGENTHSRALVSSSTSPSQQGPSWLQKGVQLVGVFDAGYWQALLVVSILYFGRFDFGWVLLRAQECNVPRGMLPVLMSTNMIITTIAAFLTGKMTKGREVGARNAVLFAGFFMLVAANALLSLPICANAVGMALACSFIGLHMGMTHGLMLSMLSSYMPHKDIPGVGSVSGTAWSFTDFVLGCILAISNQMAGRLTDWSAALSWGGVGCFLGGGCAAVAAMVVLALFTVFGSLARPSAPK